MGRLSLCVAVIFLLALGLNAWLQPTRIEFSRSKVIVELRDDRFQKCKNQEAIGAENGDYQEIWVCGSAKFYVVKKNIRYVIEGNKPHA